MATKYIEQYATEADFLADAVDAPGKLGFAAIDGEYVVANKSGSVVELVDETRAQTLTNKTLTSPTITGPTITGQVGTRNVVTPLVTGAITAAQSGSLFMLTAVADMTLTLPAPAAGLEYEFWLAASALTTSHIITTNGGSNIIFGQAVVAGALVAADAEDKINFIAANDLPGDYVRVVSDGTSWFVEGMATAAGAITFTVT
jgi:hypothetical protein